MCECGATACQLSKTRMQRLDSSVFQVHASQIVGNGDLRPAQPCSFQ